MATSSSNIPNDHGSSSNLSGGSAIVKKKVVDLVHYDEIDEIITRQINSESDLWDAVNDLYSLDHRFDIGKIQVRFLMGALLDKVGSKYGDNTVGNMAAKYNISETTLREARQLAREFNNSPTKLKVWMLDVIRQRGRVYWTDVQERIRSGSDPRVLGRKAMVRRLVTRVERVARDAEEFKQMLDEIPDDIREEHEGAMAVMYENVTAVQNQWEKINKAGHTVTPRSKEYLTWLRGQPCPISGDSDVEAAHMLGEQGTAKKKSDFGAIPLSPVLHKEYHKIGHDSFEEKYDVNMSELVLNYLHKYLTNQWLTMHLGT